MAQDYSQTTPHLAALVRSGDPKDPKVQAAKSTLTERGHDVSKLSTDAPRRRLVK